MAQEAILNVSLKDYKKNIDELRGSLLGLEKDSEDYKKIAEELKDKQDKLNEVMSVGKESVNAVDGSYNQLSATLSRLKKEWKNMEIGTPEWEAMAVRINDINDKLKDADSQVGVFTRNVGDYANAFQEAFKQAAQGLGRMPGTIGEIASMTQRLIPLIKQTTNTAVAGLTGVKKALAATGIGALIVAVGLLLAYSDDLLKLFKKEDATVKQLTFDYEALSKSTERRNAEIEQEAALMNAQGESFETISAYRRQEIRDMQALYEAKIAEIDAEIEHLHIREILGIQFGKDKKRYEELIKLRNMYAESVDKFSESLQKLNNEYDVNAAREKKTAEDKAKAKVDAEKRELEAILKHIEDANKTEIQKITEKYEKEKKLLEKYHKDTKALTEQYNKDIEAINERAIDNIASELMKYQPYAHLNREYRKAADVLEKFQQIIGRTFPPEAILKTEDITEDMIKKAQKLGLVAGDTAEEFSYAWEYAYENFKGTSNNFATSMQELNSDFLKSQELLQKSGNLRAFYENEYKAQEYLYQDLRNMLTQISNALFDFRDTGVMAEDFMKDFEGNAFETTQAAYAYWSQFFESLKVEVADVLNKYNIAVDEWTNYTNSVTKTLKDAEAEFAEFGKDNWMQWFLNTDLFYETYHKRLDAAIWYRNNLEIIEGETAEERRKREIEAEEEILRIRREYSKKHIEVSQQLTNSLVSGWGSLLDRKEALMKAEMKIDENGKKTRRYTDEDIFNETKNARIAQATIETIQGAIAAFMGYQSYPQPYGAILGAAQAAAVTAAGMAQIAQIRATQFNDAGQNISNPQAVVNATPRMADYSPDLVSNITGASDTDYLKNALQETPIYVSVTDIDNAQVRVTDRNRESSF